MSDFEAVALGIAMTCMALLALANFALAALHIREGRRIRQRLSDEAAAAPTSEGEG